MTEIDAKLGRPVWSSLTGGLAPFALREGPALRLPPEIGDFAAAPGVSAGDGEALAALIPPGGAISLVETTPPPPPDGILSSAHAAVQMTLRGAPAPLAGPAPAIEALTAADAEEMFALARLTRPGHFQPETHRLGRFLGVRIEGRLVAMGGERFWIEDRREISALCTLPEFRRRGYGQALLIALAERLRAEGLTPFLHSYADNAGAIALYEGLGFRAEREVIHAVWRRA